MTATADIVVRRCAVRVVRHGGWSWGPQPQRLVDQVLAALPGLIAARLAGLAPDGASDVEITEPVRIVVSVTLADLLAGRFDPLRHAVITAEPLPEPLPAWDPARSQGPVRPSGTPLLERALALHASTEPVTLARFLGRLFQRGELGQFLALLPADTLEAWYQSLTTPPTEAPGTRPGAAIFPAAPADRLPGVTGHPAADGPAPSPGVAATPETGRSRQLRDAITAIAARASRETAADPIQPGELTAGSHDRPPPASPAPASPAPVGLAPASPAPASPAPASPAPASPTCSSRPGISRPGISRPQAAAHGHRVSGRRCCGHRLGKQGRPCRADRLGARRCHSGARRFRSGARRFRSGARRFRSGARRFRSGARRFRSAAATAPPAATAAGTASASWAAPAGQVALAPGTAAPAQIVSAPAAVSATDVACALPFLLLGPLAQTGYLSALAPALQPVGLESQTAAFATALAYTVLGSPERGWRRQPGDLAVAAAFAGLGAPVPGPALTEFARVARPALPALDAVVTRALAEGHTAGEPLVLTGAEGGGLLLVDREGLFPVAWTGTIEGLLPAWRMFGSPPVLVAPTALGALRGLAAAGATFVVATPPGRGERWRRLPPHPLWTNNDDPALSPAREQLPAGNRPGRRARAGACRGACRGPAGRQPGAGPQPAARRRAGARRAGLDAVAGA